MAVATGAKFLLNLPPELLDSVKARAAEKGVSASEWMRRALTAVVAGSSSSVPRAPVGDTDAMASAVQKIGERQKAKAGHTHKAATRLPTGIDKCSCGAVNAGGGWLPRP